MLTNKLEEIEYLRLRIENLSIPINKSKKNEINSTNSKNNKIQEEDDENNEKIKKREQLFNEIYELYENDIEYKKKIKEKERLKALDIEKSDDFYIEKKNEKKYMEYKFKIKPFKELLDKNNHKSKLESKYEEDFSSSDSYDSDLFDLKEKAPKNFKFKTKEDIYENKGNLEAIMKTLSLSQK